MEPLVSQVTKLWNTMPPTTWLFALGLLISFNFIPRHCFKFRYTNRRPGVLIPFR